MGGIIYDKFLINITDIDTDTDIVDVTADFNSQSFPAGPTSYEVAYSLFDPAIDFTLITDVTFTFEPRNDQFGKSIIIENIASAKTAVIPEPRTYIFFCTMLLGLFGIRKRYKRG